MGDYFPQLPLEWGADLGTAWPGWVVLLDLIGGQVIKQWMKFFCI